MFVDTVPIEQQLGNMHEKVHRLKDLGLSGPVSRQIVRSNLGVLEDILKQKKREERDIQGVKS